MTRIAALNDFAFGSSDEDDAGPTREALEAEATKNYNQAIRDLASRNFDGAYDLFCLVLQNPFIEKAYWPEGVEPGGILPQDLALRYSCLKNLGNLASKRGDYDQSVSYYMEAVRVDRTEVSLWHRLGASAIKLRDFELALVAFQEGHYVNPKHWPCLDQLLSVLFILKMYIDCLGLAILGLQRDPGYIKALAFKDKIFEIQPSLKEDAKFFFKDSSVLFKDIDYDKTKGEKFIATCEALRPPNRTPKPPMSIPSQQFRKPLGELTWQNLAGALLSTYDSLMDDDGMAFAGKIDICNALNQVKDRTLAKDMEELGVAPLEAGGPFERKSGFLEGFDNRERDRRSIESLQGNPIRISGRRRTIELGESQDSFRVSEKRRSCDSDMSRLEDTKSDDGTAATAAVTISSVENCKEAKDQVKEKEGEESSSKGKETEKEGSKVAEAEGGIERSGEAGGGGAADKKSNEYVGKEMVQKPEVQISCVLEEGPEVRTTNDALEKAIARKITSAKMCRAGTGGRSIANVPHGDMEADNDFKGFTNASAYKDRHLKLVQGKNALSFIDEEDFGMEQSVELDNQIQESECVTKDTPSVGVGGEVSSSVGEQGQVPAAESVVREQGQRNDSSLIVENEECVEGLLLPRREENENVTKEMSDSKRVQGDDESRNNALRDGSETHIPGGNSDVYGAELPVYEEQVVNEADMVGNEESTLQEVDRQNVGDEFRDEAENVEEDLEVENACMEENGVIEEMEQCDAEVQGGLAAAMGEDEGVGMEEVEENQGEILEGHEDGMEENEGMMEDNEGIMEDNGMIDEGEEAILGVTEGYHEGEDGMEGMMSAGVTETEAAVNALKGIMALQPTEILGLPEPDFDYENEFEYFDGGVYEEDDDELVHQMDQEEEEEEEDIPEMTEDIQEMDEPHETTEQDVDAEQECENSEVVQQGDSSQEDEEEEEEENHPGEESEAMQTDQQKQEGGEKLESPLKDASSEMGNQAETERASDDKDKDQGGGSSKEEEFSSTKDADSKATYAREKRDTDVEDNTTTETSDKTEEPRSRVNVEVARKSKRTKRGLERELEQLDYWGRRQERDAKRRRRTISSKLLGGIEEAEYLTWADLLRSFVPGALLNVSSEDKKKEEEKLTEIKASVPAVNEAKMHMPLKTNSDNQSRIMEAKDTVLMNGHHCDAEVGNNEAASLNSKSLSELERKNKSEAAIPKTESLDVDVHLSESKDGEKRELLASEDRQNKASDEKVSSQNEILKLKREETILSSASTEEEQVQAFLMQYEDNGGILHLLQQFLKIMMKRYKFVWPLAAAKMFTDVYPRVRNHVSHGSPLSFRESRQRLFDESQLSLTHWELCCSIYQSSRNNTPAIGQNAVQNPFIGNPSHLEEDVFRLILMLGRGDVWMEETPQFHTRLRWLQAQIRLIRGQPEEAASYLELLLADLDRLAEEGTEYVCNRVRIESDTTVVSNSEVKRQLNVLQRSHMLEQVVDNYTDGRYRVVADLLTTIFHEPLPKSRSGVTLPTRQTQLAILIDSLYKLTEYKDVMYWGSFSLTEALMRYNRAEAEEEKKRWAKTLMKISDTMNTMLTNNIAIVHEVSRQRLMEVVSTLIQMLVVQLEKPQSAQILPFETLVPWILLHRILAREESLQSRGEEKSVGNAALESGGTSALLSAEKGVEGSGGVLCNNASNPQGMGPGNLKLVTAVDVKGKESEVYSIAKGPVTPYPSTLFLITAHDELGKHSWCCYDEGVFLLYTLDVLLVELRRPLDDQHRQLLHHTLEQVTFCLYSHPSKKSKHKHLRDHGVPQIAFSWGERAMQLYQYYRPSVLPDFQTSQIPSITDDAAVLFKRIIALLPDDAKPADQTAGVEAYINGEVSECSYTPFAPPTDIISDCFYLLGDYYFKSKEWMNAIKYYKLDLSINHERLESWAPLGLSMKAMLESQLNSCEVIEDEEAFFSLAKAAVQCLRQALKIDQYHTNLWVEFGGLVYMVHSHASRLLKQDLNPDISLETFDMLEKFKNEMLNLAENCFTKAMSIHEDGYEDEGLPDERWLHCYMLGKVAEKKSRSPSVIIQYYMKASRYLHNIYAKYPSRINYNSPQEFSVEALEMYYRIHAFILKYLHLREGRDVEPEIINCFTKCLDELAAGPFFNSREKKCTDGEDLDTGRDSFLNPDPVLKKRPLEDRDALEPAAKKLQSDGVLDSGSDTKRNRAEATGNKEGVDVLKEGSLPEAKVSSEKDKKESDDEIQVVEEKVVEKKDHYTVISRCLSALQTCLSRFQEHYKTMYRLAHYYHTSKFHKDNAKAQNYLLGCPQWHNVGYMPVNGLFHERKVWIQQPKNSNFFHGVWRIPNDEIDRPGSFAAHMYRCVSVILDILPQMKDFFMVLQIALALKNSPDKDKKYLRDNERELLSEHATQVGLQAMKDKYKVLFKSSSPTQGMRNLRFLLDVYKCYKQVSKHLPGSEPHFAKMLTDAYASYKNLKVENRSNILREADSFCNRHQHLQHRTGVSTTNLRNPMPSSGSAQTPPLVARRGRPPLTGRGRGRGRGSLYGTSSRTFGDMLAVQQAYKIYESLISTQTLLNKKELNQAQTYSYQKQLEGYQSQLMKYLQIPCVSHYFQASLQGLGSTSTKLPPPKPGSSSNTSTATTSGAGSSKSSGSGISAGSSSTGGAVSGIAMARGSSPPPKTSTIQPDKQATPLDALAARSQTHGISITSVTGPKLPSTQSQSLKPNMSVTVSPVKTTCPPALKGRDVSVVSVSQVSPIKSSVSISPSSKTEANTLPTETSKLPVETTKLPIDTAKLPLPSSTSFKPVSTATSSSALNPSVSVTASKPVTTIAGSTTIKPVTAVAGSTTIKPVSTVTSSIGSTGFNTKSTSGGSSTFKPFTASVSSVPKLPAGTTLTRPRDVSPTKGSGPRPQLQANPRPVKSSESENVSVKKIISQMSSSSSNPSSKASDSGIGVRSNPSLPSKPSLPKDMTITPAPRVKTQSRQIATSARPVTSPSTSFFRAFEASLGLSSSTSVTEKSAAASVSSHSTTSSGNRPISQSQTTSVSNAARVTQLSTQELLKLAYGTDGLSTGGRGQTLGGRGQSTRGRGQSSGVRGQSSGVRGQSPGGVHGQTSNRVPSHSSQFPKSASQQQQRVQSKQPNSPSTLPSSSTLTLIQSTLNKQQSSGTQQQSPQQSRTTQQTSANNVSQSKPVNKSNPSKPPPKSSSSSDDIITLD